jgi:hypothetical protein
MPSEISYEDSLLDNTKPRYKGDDFANYFQRKIDSTKAAVDILRSNPRTAALLEASDAPVEFVQTLGEYTGGDYTPQTGKIRIAANASPRGMATTLHHELIHHLSSGKKAYFEPRKDMAHSGKFRDNPLATLDEGAGFSGREREVPGEKTPNQFYEDLRKADKAYGMNEPAAFLASQVDLPRSQQDTGIRQVVAQNPVLSTMFARLNTRPDLPLPKHYKAPAEYDIFEKGLNKLFGYQPTLDTQQNIDATRNWIHQKLLREIPPQERH